MNLAQKVLRARHSTNLTELSELLSEVVKDATQRLNPHEVRYDPKIVVLSERIAHVTQMGGLKYIGTTGIFDHFHNSLEPVEIEAEAQE